MKTIFQMLSAIFLAGYAMKRLMFIAIALILAGCISAGPLAPPPIIEADSARVVFIRPSWLGFLNTGAVSIDGVELFGLNANQHVAFAVRPGERIVGVRTPDPVVPFTRVTATATLQAEAGKTYYYRVEAGRLDRMPDAEGARLMGETEGLTRP
jgi:hypothetical protein